MILQNIFPFLLKHCVRRHHIYKSSYCSSSELAEKLCSNLIYDKDGIVVLNKPYGISFSQSDPNPHNDNLDEVSLKTILPHLTKILGYPTLLNAKVPEKYISGVAIFCINKETLLKVKKALKQTREYYVPQDEYITVVVGSPISSRGAFKGGITLLTSPISKKEKKAYLVTTYSKKALKRGDVINVKLQHHIIKEGKHASLVSVSSTRNRWHCIRTYLSSKLLSPVLGDNLFGSRVKTVLGAPVVLDLFSPAASCPQKLSQEIKKMLDIKERKDLAVPLHIHLNRTVIHNFNKKVSLEFTADPPETFKWTCERLSLIRQN